MSLIAYSLRHCDLVQLHGFLGLTPEASNVVLCAAACAPTAAASRSSWPSCTALFCSFLFRNASYMLNEAEEEEGCCLITGLTSSLRSKKK